MIVKFHGNILEHTNGEKSFEPESCSNLLGLKDELVSRYGESFAELLSNDALFFLVNGKGTMLTGGLETPLKKGDRVEVLPFVDAG